MTEKIQGGGSREGSFLVPFLWTTRPTPREGTCSLLGRPIEAPLEVVIFRGLLLTLGAPKGTKNAAFDAPIFLRAAVICAVGRKSGHCVMSHVGVKGVRLGRDGANGRRCSTHSCTSVHTITHRSLFGRFDSVQYLTGEEPDFLQVHFLQVQSHQFLVEQLGVFQ